MLKSPQKTYGRPTSASSASRRSNAARKRNFASWRAGLEEPEGKYTLATASRQAGYSLAAVPLAEEQVRDFYLGFSNEIVWPLFHDLPSLCKFEPRYWRTYCASK